MPPTLLLPSSTDTNKPFRSSHLALPPSPFSPRFPLTPPALPQRTPASQPYPSLTLPAPPPQPLSWLWQCHLCTRVYRLGTTRRCLDDGHAFCAGTTTTKRSRRSGRKVVRHKACASEFDYAGWKVWGAWRRDCGEQRRAAGVLVGLLERGVEAAGMGWWGTDAEEDRGRGKDCWGRCDYPSECRWGRQYGVATPTTTTASPERPPLPQREAVMNAPPVGGGEDMILDLSTLIDESLLAEAEDVDVDMDTEPQTSPVDEKAPSMTELLESAKRRKRKSTGATPSPLALDPASLEVGMEDAVEKATDDFEVDLRRSIGRAVSSLFGKSRDGGRRRNSAASTCSG